MDIRNWPLDQIMQLPDCCFGRRFAVSCYALSVAGVPAWDIAEIPFPEKFVLWELVAWSSAAVAVGDIWRLALGDQLPTVGAVFDALEPLIPGLGLTMPEPRNIALPYVSSAMVSRLRNPINAMGRRMVLEVDADAATTKSLQVVVVVSSIPKEVPDWLFSGQGRSL